MQAPNNVILDILACDLISQIDEFKLRIWMFLLPFPTSIYPPPA